MNTSKNETPQQKKEREERERQERETGKKAENHTPGGGKVSPGRTGPTSGQV